MKKFTTRLSRKPKPNRKPRFFLQNLPKPTDRKHFWNRNNTNQDATWYWGRPRPRSHYTRRGPRSLEGGTAAPSFPPMSIVATVVYLSYCWALVTSAKEDM